MSDLLKTLSKLGVTSVLGQEVTQKESTVALRGRNLHGIPVVFPMVK